MRSSAFLAAALLTGAVAVLPAAGRDGGDHGDRDRDRAAEAATRAADRAAERASRDAARFADEQIKIETRAAEERNKARSPEELAKAEGRAAEDQAKLDADRAKAEAKATEEAAKAAADVAEAEAKAAEDAAKDAADAAEDAADEAADAMKDIGKSENPEYDDSGFPVRRGEIVALNLTGAARRSAEAQGFRVIGQTQLRALGATVTRLSTPEGTSARDALEAMRRIDGSGVFDFTHYYALNVGAAGKPDGTALPPMARREGRFRVGMIDTSIVRHPALDGVALTVRDFSGAGSPPTMHGTAVASLLASAGGQSLFVANVFKQDAGEPFTSADAIARALEWMAEAKVDVINISLAGPPNEMLNHIIAAAIAHGHVIVAAAGNDGPAAPPVYPAADAGVVAVTAVDARHRVYRYANHGDYITVAARGVNVAAAAPDGKVSGFTGTSFAAPVVAGYLARCLDEGTRERAACEGELERGAKDLGAPGRDPVYGFGLIE